jgi:hypothetical protein
MVGNAAMSRVKERSTMSRTLRYLGLIVLVGTAWLSLADLGGWVPSGTSDQWTSKGIVIGLACLGAGMLLRMLRPLGRKMEQDRCVQCGASTERGHRYCRDHLKAALDEARDRTRRTLEATRDAKESDF